MASSATNVATTKRKMRTKKMRKMKREVKTQTTAAESLSLDLASQADFNRKVKLTKNQARKSPVQGVAEQKEAILAVKKQLREATSNVIYLGHIPHGFYEQEMTSYFTQFGTVRSVQLARSRITGKSKGFAFIHFESEDVARIAAETMNNYLMYEHLLKCHVIPRGQVKLIASQKANRFRGPFVPKVRRNRMKEEYNKPRTAEQVTRSDKRLVSQVVKTAKALTDLGIAFDASLLIPPHLMPTQSVVGTNPDELAEESDDVQEHTDDELLNPEDYLEIDTSDDEITFKVPPNTRTITLKRKKKQQEDQCKRAGSVSE